MTTQETTRSTTESDERVERARKRAKELREFYVHFAMYLTVNVVLAIGLFTINWLASPDGWWFWIPLLGTGIGWGIGVAIHAVNVFATGTFFGEDWEERKVRELMEHDQIDPRHT